jgi:hypothetical protein
MFHESQIPALVSRITSRYAQYHSYQAVWNFEFESLEFIWDLVFGAWNLHDFIFAGNNHNISQLLD